MNQNAFAAGRLAALIALGGNAWRLQAADPPPQPSDNDAAIAQVDVISGRLPAPAAVALLQEESIFERRPPNIDRITWHVASLDGSIRYFSEQLQTPDMRPVDRRFAESMLSRIRRVQREDSVRLTLEDALKRALYNSHLVRIQSYLPAIGTATLVEAEAAFDATFFSNLTKNKQDVPSASQLAPSKFDTLLIETGVRKTLANGMRVSTSLEFQRRFLNLQFQLLNPEYTSTFVAQFTQPLLRNGGIDFNRSQIEIARNDLKISGETFKRQVRDILFNTEQAYWRLVQARREVVINSRQISEFEKIYDYLWQRRNFDTYQIQLSQTKASLEAQKAGFVRIVNNVFDAEDTLIALMNDSEIDLSTDIEIIPVDFPTALPQLLETAAEVQVALDNRSELHEGYLRIDNANLRVGQAKNQALPLFDLTFRWRVPGLGKSFDLAFDETSRADFMEYLVVLNLEVPIGNRAAMAALRRSRLLHAQEMARLKNQIEQVILEVNNAVREIRTTFDQLEPNLQSADANEDQVRSVIARAERKDFPTLNQELSARNALASSRSNLLRSLVDYNIALIELERSKGTLLKYDNVVLDQNGE